MKRAVWARLVPGLAMVLVLSGCSGNDAEGVADDNPTTTSSTEAASPSETVASNDTDTTVADDSNEPAAAPAGAGTAILTVGDQTWTFDNFYCAFGPEETQNDRVSFSSGSFGENEDGRIQLDASIQDTDEQGRYEGESTIQSVTLNDIENFETPSVALSAESGFLGAPEFLIQIDGDHISVTALFDDDLTEEIESIEGSLEATCGS